MIAYIVMGIIVVWVGAAIPFVRYLERKEREGSKPSQSKVRQHPVDGRPAARLENPV